MKKRAHAVYATGNAGYVAATVVGVDGRWRVRQVRQWSATPVRRILLFGTGMCLAVPSHWRRGVAGRDEVVAGDEGEEVLSARASRTELEHRLGELSGNITSVIPAEAYLCSIPLSLAPDTPEHFLAVRQMSDCVEIGLIRERFLSAVFRLAPAGDDALAGHLERLRRYLIRSSPQSPVPDKVYVIGPEAPRFDVSFDVEALPTSRLDAGELDDNQVRAVGAALADARPVVGLLHGETDESVTRGFRAALVAGAAAVLAASVVTVGGSLVYDLTGEHMLNARRRQYQRVLDENSDMRRLSDNTADLARRILELEQTLASQTRWTELLELLVEKRPKGLRFEQLGSERPDDSDDVVVIGLTGWSRSQADVTEFIGKLQQVQFLSNISLASLERLEDSNLTAFRIVCSLHLYDT